MIDSELPWAANRTVLMKEEMDVVGTTPVGDTNDSGFESDLEWPEVRNDVQSQKNPEFYPGIKKSPEQR